jgi:polyhydroxyalkanoate synthesis repressor PhaR
MRTVKRYANRKLYDTESKSYVTLDQIAGWVKASQDIRVVDSATNEDITNVTLSQILLEKEKQHKNSLPRSFFTGVLQQGARIRDTLLAKADSVLGDRVEEAMRHLRVPTRTDLAAIEKRVAELEAKIATLGKKPRIRK